MRHPHSGIKRHWLILVAVAALVISTAAMAMAAPPPWAPVADHVAERFGFDDLDEAAWAKGPMTLMAAKGAFQGRSQGKMAPQSAVNRAELLTAAVRLNLLAHGEVTVAGENETPTPDAYVQELYETDDDFVFGFDDSAVITLGAASWSAGYIYTAIGLGLIENEGELQPMAAAHRDWVAEILVKALDAFIDFDEGDGTLEFTDTGELDPEVAAYISAAVSAGLFTGYPDGAFNPHRPLTRAELMTLMGRADEQFDLIQAPDIHRGFISDIMTENGTVTAITVVLTDDDDDANEDANDEGNDEGDLESELEGELTFQLTAETIVFLKNQESDASRLQVGDKVHVKAQQDDETGAWIADTIWAFFEQWEVTGHVTAIHPADGDDPNRLSVEVTTIEAPEEGELPLELEEGDETTLTVADYATLRFRGEESPYDPELIQLDDHVELKLHGTLVISVVVGERVERELTGTVVTLDDESGTITVEVLENDPEHPVTVDEDGHFTMTVTDETTILYQGQEVGFETMALGDTLEIKIEGEVVTRLTLEKPEEPEAEEEEEEEEEENGENGDGENGEEENGDGE